MDFNLKHHFASEHERWCAILFSDTRTRKAKASMLNLEKKKTECFYNQNKLQEAKIQAGFLVACNIAKQNKQLWTVYGGHS
jgi:hypothetical protein